ncbi:hypothetical protein J6590_081317 [Homalodisca vitripennis]|nr:hypothetical protein J6590_081317 [Homalodisca vitripennis]
MRGMLLSDVCNLDRNSPTSSTRAQLHRSLVLRGTNSKDLAAGEQHSIYLESHVTTRHFNTSLVISTVPYRRNLLGSNEEITLLEAYIHQLDIRHNARFLDFNKIKTACTSSPRGPCHVLICHIHPRHPPSSVQFATTTTTSEALAVPKCPQTLSQDYNVYAMTFNITGNR